ncbi:hypothetical protein L345_10053 [Ophiophagus hannah]|uniref:Uncharacterized protein n=1 Tax=Ophiophagus hannah TaxID=8665 RepID=V8NRJ8_OPHHA|nr:hypothetical protein L345_10053 [Ophiophagus hannah]
MVVILHGVDQLHFYRYYLQFKHLRKTFKHRFCLPALSGGFIEKLGRLGTNDGQQLSSEETTDRKGAKMLTWIFRANVSLVPERDEVPIIQKHTEKVCRLSSYILTREEMRVYDYPVEDTSLLYVRKGGRRFKLKFLAAAVLGKEIQSTAQLGHDPTEDAQSALELAQYFIEQGPRKVAELNLEARLSEQRKMGETETKVNVEQNDRIQKGIPNSSEKTLLLGGPDDVQNHTASSNEQILQKALEEIPKSPVNVIQLALAPFLSLPKPHLCIQYEVLEGAQLALEDLNGAEIGGSVLKVQRPVTEMTLEGEMLLQELERDPENEATLYLAGLKKCQEETELREQLGPLEGLRSIFWPRDLQSRRQKNYCFLSKWGHKYVLQNNIAA